MFHQQLLEKGTGDSPLSPPEGGVCRYNRIVFVPVQAKQLFWYSIYPLPARRQSTQDG
jgi:hypothetical protein